VPRLDEGTEWLMWQCSDRGTINGINEKVDINIFNGNREQFKSLLIK
jgi:lysozyme